MTYWDIREETVTGKLENVKTIFCVGTRGKLEEVGCARKPSRVD
jgi:hypothetical protein